MWEAEGDAEERGEGEKRGDGVRMTGSDRAANDK